MKVDLRGLYADKTFTELETAALQWLDGFYQLEHLLSARAWTIRLCGGAASSELKFAALVHDAERFFPGGPSSTPGNGFDDPDYLFAHSIRSADIVESWMRERQPVLDDGFIRRVRALILRHEIGGGWEADLLQAADSLSFIETLDWLTVDWVRKGVYTKEEARQKLRWMVERIRPPLAMQWAIPIHEHAVHLLEHAYELDVDLVERRRAAGDRALMLGH